MPVVFIYRGGRVVWEGKEEQGEAFPTQEDSPLWFRVHRGQCESFSGLQGALDQAQGTSLSHDRIKTHTHFYEWKLFFLFSEWLRSEHSCYFALCSESLLILKYWNSDIHSPRLTWGPFSIIVPWEEYSNSCRLYFFELYYCWDSFHFRLKKQATGAKRNADIILKYELSKKERPPQVLKYSDNTSLASKQEMQKWIYMN